MSYEKIIDKLKKLKELAERGDAFEKDVARQKLEEMLLKYNISESEITNTDILERVFRYKKNDDNRTILTQVIFSVVADAKVYCHPTKKEVYCKTDYSQYIEIVEKCKHFIGAYEKQKELFTKAFIHKNQLYSTSETKETSEKQPMTKDEISQLIGIMGGMRKEHYVNTNKQIETKQ